MDRTISDLVNNYKAFRGVDYLRGQFERANRTEQAENNYRELVAIFREEVQNLRREIPNLKGVERLDSLMNRL